MIFTKGEKVRQLPIPSKPFWNDLERHSIETEAKPSHYLMARLKTIPYGRLDERGHRKVRLRQFPELLGRSSIQTTGDVYADWDLDELAVTLADVLREETAGANRRDIAVVVGDSSEARDSIATRPGAPGFGRAIRSAA